MLMVADPLTGRELREQRPVETAGVRKSVSSMTAAWRSLASRRRRRAAVLAAGGLAVDEQAEPVLARQLGGFGRILQLDEGIGHRGEARARRRSTVGWVSMASPSVIVAGAADVLWKSGSGSSAGGDGRRSCGSSGWWRPSHRSACRGRAPGRRRIQALGAETLRQTKDADAGSEALLGMRPGAQDHVDQRAVSGPIDAASRRMRSCVQSR